MPDARPVISESITITCVRHRRKVTRGKRLPVTGAVFWHVGGVDGPPCDSRQFTVRREQVVGRDQADGELMVLELRRQATERADNDMRSQERSEEEEGPGS